MQIFFGPKVGEDLDFQIWNLNRAHETTSGPISRCILNMFLNILIYECVMSLMNRK